MWLWLAVAGAAVLGHMCSPWLRFGGGKGVATGFGAMLAMFPLLTFPALAALVVWYACLRLTRYVSLASIAGAASLPVWYLVWVIPRDAEQQPFQHTLQRLAHAWPPLVVTAALAALVLYKHRSNLARLRRGEEPKVGSHEVTK